MPQTLDQHQSSQVVKLLNIGESKTGKTGSLASLVTAGYRLWILDYDNGLDILANLLRDDPDALKRVTYKTLRDKITMLNGIPRVKTPPTAFKQAGDTLAEWKADTFTPNDVLVLDTLSAFSEAGFQQALFLAGRLNQRSQQTDYGWMNDSVRLFIETITSPEMNCHIVVNTHVRYFAGDDDTQTQARGLPNAKGQEIPRTVSRFFNTVILTRSVGTGAATKRLITTQPQGVVEVATSNPTGVKPTYPIDVGMQSLFKDILGHGPAKEAANVIPLKEKPNATA